MKASILAALAAGVGAMSVPMLKGSLVGLYVLPGNDMTNVTMLAVDPNTGINTTIATGLTLDGLQQTYPAKSVLNPKTNDLVVAAATADAIYSFSTTTGARTTLAALPAYDGTDPYLALHYVGSDLFLVTQSAVWQVTGGALKKVATLTGFPDDAVSTVVPVLGKNGAIFVANATIPHHNSTLLPAVYTIDVAGGFAVDQKYVNVTDIWDVAWSPYLNSQQAGSMWMFGGWYQSFFLNPATADVELVAKVIDGPGYPKVCAMSASGRYFAFLDFASLHVLDLTQSPPAYVVQGTFSGAPRAIGYMQWLGSN